MKASTRETIVLPDRVATGFKAGTRASHLSSSFLDGVAVTDQWSAPVTVTHTGSPQGGITMLRLLWPILAGVVKLLESLLTRGAESNTSGISIETSPSFRLLAKENRPKGASIVAVGDNTSTSAWLCGSSRMECFDWLIPGINLSETLCCPRMAAFWGGLVRVRRPEAAMKHIDGNLRPLKALSRAKVNMLPSSRIQCASGRIRVGDRTYLSASDALSAYLQQFDGKQQQQQSSVQLPASSVRASSSYAQHAPLSSSIDGLVQRAPANHFSGSLSGNPGAASVTGLLTGSPRSDELTRTTLNSSSHLNSHGYSTGVTFQDTTNASVTPRGDSRESVYGHQSASKVNGFHSSDSDSTGGGGFGIVNGFGQGEVTQTATPRARSEIETLLSSQPSHQLIQTPPARRQMALEAQDALREVKLKRLITENNNRSNGEEKKKSSLQQEVEEALSRSAQLLETIQTDALVSPRCVSDVGSLNTDILLSVNPYNPGDVVTGRQSRSRHRYSYHTAGHHHARSLSLGRVPGSEAWQPSLRESGRRRSVDSLGPSVTSSLWKEKMPQDVNSSTTSSVSAMSDPSDILKHLQTLSSSPYAMPGDRFGNRELPHRVGPPSWIQELIPPTPGKGSGALASDGVEHSVFSERDVTGGRAPPSWVNGMDQSDVASSVDTQDLRDAAEVLAVKGIKALTNGTATDVDDSVLTDLSYAGPGLNYSDLITSPAPTKHKVSFSSHTKPPSLNVQSRVPGRPLNSGVLRNRNDDVRGRVEGANGKPPTGRIHQDLAGVDVVRSKPHNLSGTLSSSVGAVDSSSRLRKKISEDSVEVKRSLDEYLARLSDSGGGGGGSAGRAEAALAGIPRCSSLDMLNALGPQVSVPSDVTGASPITKDSNFSSKLCLDDPTLTPAKQVRMMEMAAKGVTVSPELEDLLDGDRPWENMAPSFKAPVHVGNSSPGKLDASTARPATPTLSGGQQPGSMEALKKMLFRLQTEEASGSPPSTGLGAQMENGGASSLIPALADYNFEDEPGGQSLEKALVHLGRLKTLVQTTGKKETEQDTASQK
ncbi:hypothetical protein BaRGS_00021959 [Batillaria attramentaria]|uniref:Uncharacterized protein n=1 Tax=Batillaria attramentaria TaxID=370345 RepID=A0ABD0KID8_9CAEN